jgi:hypothetical protein
LFTTAGILAYLLYMPESRGVTMWKCRLPGPPWTRRIDTRVTRRKRAGWHAIPFDSLKTQESWSEDYDFCRF